MAGPHRVGEAVGQAVAVGAAGRRQASRRKRRWSARPVDSSRGLGTGSVRQIVGSARSPKTAGGQGSWGSGHRDGGATAVSRRQRVLGGGVEALRVAALGPGAALLLR